MARPTKYTPELLEAAREYVNNFKEHGDVIPSHAGLAVVLKLSRETLYAWNNQEGKEPFSDILSEILVKQENLLMNGGLSGDFNAAITKLVLGKHGYHEKVDNEHTGKAGGAIKSEVNISFIPVGNKD